MAEMEIDRNERVVAPDGSEIGRVKHVIVDGPGRQVTDLVVEQHGGEEILVPLASIERYEPGTLMMRETTATMGNRGMFDRAMYHEVDENAIADTPVAGVPGAATLEHASRDSAVIGDTRTARDVPAETRQQPAREQAGRREQTARDGENITVPVIEERLKAGVRETEAGKFRLSKRVVEEQKTIDVPVEHEEVRITETAVNRRPATAEELKMMDRDIEIPLKQQEVVTSKEARVVGEVDVRKEVTRDTERVTDTVRREEVHVEDSTNPRVHVEGERGMTGREGGGKTVTDKRQYDAQGNLVDEKISEKPSR